MPNRILRDWTDSERVDELTVHGERFFTRLIMKVDDYGRYNANIKFLKSTLFPLKTDVRETDITRWLAECEKSGLITLYIVSQKEYVQIENFKQVLRQKKEKYPSPIKNDSDFSASHLHSTCNTSASLNRNEVESEYEVESEEKNSFFLIPEFLKFFSEENQNYAASEIIDFPAIRKFADFISFQLYKKKDYTALNQQNQLCIFEELKKVSSWYKKSNCAKSLDTLAKFSIQQVFTEIKTKNKNSSSFEKKVENLNATAELAMQLLTAKENQE